MKPINIPKFVLLITMTLFFVSCGTVTQSKGDAMLTDDVQVVVDDDLGGNITESYTDRDSDSRFCYECELNCSLNYYLKIFETPYIQGIEDIVGYFSDIIDDGKQLPSRFEEDDLVNRVMAVARDFQNIRDGRSKHYPAEEIKSILSSMLYDLAYYENHLFYYTPRLALIVQRLLDFAAYYAPSIYDLATVCSKDGEWGAIYFSSYYNELYRFTTLINKYKESKNVTRYQIVQLPNCFSPINKIREVADGVYLATYEQQDEISSCFLLYNNFGNRIIDLNNSYTLDNWNYSHRPDSVDDLTLYFNPKELSWQWCVKNKFGNLEQVEGSSTLRLDRKNFAYIYIE